ncbi:MAG: tyrosine-type recombinase/integrase [Kofleriaceae bacterium]
MSGTPGALGPYHDLANSKIGAQEAEGRAIAAARKGKAMAGTSEQKAEGEKKQELPTFSEWFHGRFWTEHVIAQDNKPSEVESKQSIMKIHLEPMFGSKRLDEIDIGAINRFRASLLQKKLSKKRINNILAVLSKALRYADDVELIKAPRKIGLFKVERPEIEAWDLEQYARILVAAKKEGPAVYAAACLAGEAGLRVGEVKGLRWREDVDMVAKTITVNQQVRRGIAGTPKGRTRRTIPMTPTLYEALRSLEVVREGYVVLDHIGRGETGRAKCEENVVKRLMERLCRKAGLPESGWHRLRHSFGTHAAMFGVNPWRLMTWMGHKRVDETMLYVHVAEQHHREIPSALVKAGAREIDPDRRVLVMLSERCSAWQQIGSSHEKTHESRLTLVG